MVKAKTAISMIAAMDLDNHIATAEGKLPWGKLPADKQWYLDRIRGHTLIMGSTTYEAADHSREGNRLVVLSRQDKAELGLPDDVEVVNSAEEILQLEPQKGETEVFVTGGAQVFALMMPHADKLCLTVVETHFPGAEGGVKFPEIEPKQWQVELRQSHPKDDTNPYPYTFYIYRRS